MSRRLFKVDVEVKRPDGSGGHMVRFNILADSENEARNSAMKSAKRMGKGLVRGGLFVRPAASTRGGEYT